MSRTNNGRAQLDRRKPFVAGRDRHYLGHGWQHDNHRAGARERLDDPIGQCHLRRTMGTGDICAGAADGASGLASVGITLRRASDSQCWNPPEPVPGRPLHARPRW
jgi:hypothetical protein